MKRLITIFFVVFYLLSAQINFGQVFVDFENPADTTNGFFDAAWFGPMASFGRIADPTGRSAGVLELQCDGTLADRGVVQSFNRFPNGATIAAFKIYLPANFPDSAIVSVWGDDNATGWNWNATEYYGVDLPKETWYPVYFNMEIKHIELPDGFDPFGENYLAHFGIQIFYTEPNWVGTVLLDDAAFLQKDILSDFENAADTTDGFFDAAWFGPMTSFGRVDDPTGRSTGVLKLDCSGSLADRAVVQKYTIDDKEAAIFGFHIYLPANFPDSAIVSVWGDDNATGWNWNATEYYGVDLPKETWYPVYFLMEAQHIILPEGFDPTGENYLFTAGIQFFYQDLSWSGTILVDDNALYSPDFEPTAVEDQITNEIPQSFKLYANYPNPFNPTTTISYSITHQTDVNLVVYDFLGNEIKTLVSQDQQAGNYSVMWDGTNKFGAKVSSGVYFYSIQTNTDRQTQKMVLMK